MANILQKIFTPSVDEVVQNYTIHSWHVSQSVDAFTGVEAYDITVSGSLVVTGSVAIHTLPNSYQNGVVLYDDVTGLLYYTASDAFNVNNFYTSSITQSITSSTVNNTINNSTINQTIISSSVNTPAPSNQYIQYNSGSTFGASPSFQYVYPIESFQQGSLTIASGNYSHAQGKSTLSQGAASHAEGQETLSIGQASHAEGYLTSASANFSHAEGNATKATAPFSHAEGTSTQATATGSHTEGQSTLASANYAHAEGFSTTAMASFAHAEGFQSVARGAGSHAEGQNTLAQGLQSHAEGSLTWAQGNQSHAEGYNTTSSGAYSHAEGESTSAGGTASHTAGLGTITNASYQYAIGQYNLTMPTSPYSFIIGNGVSNASRSNLVFASGSLFQITGSASISSTLNVFSTLTTSGSRVRKYRTITLTDADYSVSPSKQVQSDDDILLIIDTTTAACPAGEGNLNITNFLNSPAGRCVEIVKIRDGIGDGIIIINSTMAGGTTLYLNNSTQPNGSRTICSSVGNSITLMSLGVTPSGSAWGNGY
jgi:hypothetical protein